MTRFAPGTDLSGINTMTGLPRGQSRPRSPRRGTVKGSRPRPDMPSPKPPMGGRPPMFGGGRGRPPIRDRRRERKDLLTGGKRPPMFGGGGRPTRPPRRGGGIQKNDDFTRGSGMSLQVITPWVNKETGKTWNAPNSGYTPREGSGWERVRRGGKSQEQLIAERRRK